MEGQAVILSWCNPLQLLLLLGVALLNANLDEVLGQTLRALTGCL